MRVNGASFELFRVGFLTDKVAGDVGGNLGREMHDIFLFFSIFGKMIHVSVLMLHRKFGPRPRSRLPLVG